MAKIAGDLFEEPSSVGELVRDLEDSGYPVDFSREQVIRQPDGPSVPPDTSLAIPRRLSSVPTKCATPRDRTSSFQSVKQNPDSLALTELTEELVRRRAYQFIGNVAVRTVTTSTTGYVQRIRYWGRDPVIQRLRMKVPNWGITM